MPRHDPPSNVFFRIEVDGIASAGFSQALLGASTVGVIEYREGTDLGIRKVPGLTRYGNVTLKRGITQSLELFQWFQQAVQGQFPAVRRNVAVILLDSSFNEVARFVIHNAWPTKYEVGALDATGHDIAIETLELTHEGLERVQ